MKPRCPVRLYTHKYVILRAAVLVITILYYSENILAIHRLDNAETVILPVMQKGILPLAIIMEKYTTYLGLVVMLLPGSNYT